MTSAVECAAPLAPDPPEALPAVSSTYGCPLLRRTNLAADLHKLVLGGVDSFVVNSRSHEAWHHSYIRELLKGTNMENPPKIVVKYGLCIRRHLEGSRRVENTPTVISQLQFPGNIPVRFQWAASYWLPNGPSV